MRLRQSLVFLASLLVGIAAAHAANSYTQATVTATPVPVVECIDPNTGDMNIVMRFDSSNGGQARPNMGYRVLAAGGPVMADNGTQLAASSTTVSADLTTLRNDITAGINSLAAAGKFNP